VFHRPTGRTLAWTGKNLPYFVVGNLATIHCGGNLLEFNLEAAYVSLHKRADFLGRKLPLILRRIILV